MFNLHTHTYRCNHASGTDEEYVIQAIENGYSAIGFSDHVPYVFPKLHHSSFRMSCDLTEGYVNSVNELKEKYKDKIDIYLGYEVEWYPRYIEKELEYLKSFGYDYLILGQHYTDSEVEPWAKYTGSQTDSIETLDKYIAQVIAGAKSGEFIYVAHPDLINFTGDREVYLEKMTAMVKELKEIDIPLEFNFLGYTDGRNYPADDFWKVVSETKNRVVLGLDAHQPEVYADSEQLSKALVKLASMGITPIENINAILKKAAQ